MQEKLGNIRKKHSVTRKLFWPFTVWINCSSNLKHFANSRPSASNFKSFSQSLEQFFLTIGQNNFCNKIPIKSVLSTHKNKMQKILFPSLFLLFHVCIVVVCLIDLLFRRLLVKLAPWKSQHVLIAEILLIRDPLVSMCTIVKF